MNPCASDYTDPNRSWTFTNNAACTKHIDIYGAVLDQRAHLARENMAEALRSSSPPTIADDVYFGAVRKRRL